MQQQDFNIVEIRALAERVLERRSLKRRIKDAFRESLFVSLLFGSAFLFIFKTL